MDKKITAAFGIDLGTTNSVISTIPRGKKPVTIDLTNGKRTMPSCVLWKDGKFVVGKEAYENRYLPSAVYSVKSLMQEVNTTVDVDCDGKIVQFTPTQISAEILKGLVEQTGNVYGEVHDVCITVPAYFNQNGISNTEEAARLAGLNPTSIVREPTAASLCYDDEDSKETKDVIVFDFGGGTYDLSIIRIMGKGNVKGVNKLIEIYGLDPSIGEEIKNDLDKVVVLGIDGDTSLGGDNIDKELYKVVEQKAKDRDPNVQLLDKLEKEKLILRLENIKKTIDKTSIHTITYGDTQVLIHYDDVKRATMPVFNKLCSIADKVLRETSHNAKDILLVGGSTKSEILRELLREKYPQFSVIDALNPDESVANGAAIKAYNDKFEDKIVQVFDILPLAISINEEGRARHIIPAKSQVPISNKSVFTTVEDNQKELEVEILQGNSRIASECVSLGKLLITDLPRGKAGELDIYITVSISVDNMLKCTCTIEGKTNVLELNLKGASASTIVSPDKSAHRFIERWKLAATRMSKENGNILLDMIADFEKGTVDKLAITDFIKKNV